MGLNTTKFILFAFLLSTLAKVQAQCDLLETISVCDMTIIDYDGDGELDGIINLYDKYNTEFGGTISTTTGTWFDPSFSFALDAGTGNLHLWDLDLVSTSIGDYQFILYSNDPSCTSGVAITLNLVLGPFSGHALHVANVGDVNIEFCDKVSSSESDCLVDVDIDLFQALESVPSPHKNGKWIVRVPNSNIVSLSGSILRVNIPYQPGPPLVDEDRFQLTYTVDGILPCVSTVSTNVNISVVRQVFSGYPVNRRICESEIKSGNYDTYIDLRNDAFLVQEDTEGVWNTSGIYGQITSPLDSEINIKEIYEAILISDGLRFGCKQIDYTYSVNQRSAVCGNLSSTVSFKIYEELRPFQQDAPLEYCEDERAMPSSLNLYNQLEFTSEVDPLTSDEVLFAYDRNEDTDWYFISGPSDLDLVTRAKEDNGLFYSYLGGINLLNAAPGTYVFQYTVSPLFNCSGDDFFVPDYTTGYCSPMGSSLGFCPEKSARVTLVIHPIDYAGENTFDLEFCETDPIITSPLDLFTLLTTNGIDDPIVLSGTWSDLVTGNTITNRFTIPEINDQKRFNFVYETTAANGCTDSANLSFDVYELYKAGTSVDIDVCDSTPIFDLFDRLGGSPNTNGIWIGPNSYATINHNAIFDPIIAEAGIYRYTVPDNVNASGTIMCAGGDFAEVTVTLHQSPNAGVDVAYFVCRSDKEIDLFDYLDTSAITGGDFVDLDATNVLTGSTLDVSQLRAGVYNFQYEIQGHASCDLSTSQLEITVIEVVTPTANNQTFCVSDGATISSLQANNGLDYNWYDTATATNVLSLGTVLVNGEDYFVAALDIDNCESERISIIVTLLPIDHVDCNDCINDGVSVNNDNINDEFDLCNLPVSFPNFEIQIYNRYGSIVYKGNISTPLFKGVSNVSLTMGKNLPSGVYFYVFDPKDGSTEAFQGNFYLSR